MLTIAADHSRFVQLRNHSPLRVLSLSMLGSLLLAVAPALAVGSATSLTVGEGFVNPIGFHDAKPTFSWKLPPGVKKQTAWRIQATVDNKTWDSGWVKSAQSTFVPYGGDPLNSRAIVTWRVNFKDEDRHEAGWSTPATFELGLLLARDWTAKWIRPAQEMPTNREPVGVLRRSFPVEKKVARARLYVTARGLFEINLNGQRVGHDYFTPGFTPYYKRIDTLTYDVTSQLHQGNNSLEGLLGTGWYGGDYAGAKTGTYGRDIALLAQLEISYEDGSSETIDSDDKWKGTWDGPVISSSIYDGEKYDARNQPTNWPPVLADTNPGSAALTPKPFAPVRQTQTLTVQNITRPQPGHYVFDLGQNMVGWARIKIPVESNQTVTIRFAEMLNSDGTLYTTNYRSAKSTDYYIAATNGTIDWEPHFTFHGFRYVQLTGFPTNVAPQADWVTGVVLHSDLPAIGTFDSSDAKLNQLQTNIIWGWCGNSLDIPTDCPQRDERKGWTGDGEIFCSTAMFNTEALAFYNSWLGSMRDEQDADGVIPNIIPTNNEKARRHSPGWMDAATIVPWSVYVSTGDTNILADNYEMMEKLVGWYQAQSTNGLLPRIGGYGDWLQPYTKAVETKHGITSPDRRGDTPFPILGAAFYAHSAQILADSARVLGHKKDARRYDHEAAKVRKAFAKQYFDADGKLKNAPETQTAYVLAIAFDLLPAKLKAKAGNNLARLVNDAGVHLRTGFLGTPFLCSALDQTRHADLASELLFQESYPSWFYPINQGATTMWERWNSYTRDNGFGDASMNSFNHYAYGAIGQWMYERVAGLAPDPASPGYKHFFIRPLIVNQLDSARAELQTPYGNAMSAWMKKDGNVEMDIIVPPNTTATVELPDGHTKKVDAGTYHFSSVVEPK